MKGQVSGKVVIKEGSFSSGWSFIRVVSYQDGLSSGWSFIRGSTELLKKLAYCGLTMLFRYSGGTYYGNEFTRNLSANTQSQSSQLTKPLRTDPGLNSGIGILELSSLMEKKKDEKKHVAGKELSSLPQKSSQAWEWEKLFVQFC